MLLVGVAQGRARGAGAGQQAGGLSQAGERARPTAESLHAVSHTPWLC